MPAVVASCTISALVNLQVVVEAREAIFGAVVVLMVTAAAAAPITSHFALIQDVDRHPWYWWEFRIRLPTSSSLRTDGAGVAAGIPAVIPTIVDIAAVAVEATLPISLLAGARFMTRLSAGVVHQLGACGLIE